MVCRILVMRNELPSVVLAVFYRTGIETCIDVDRQGGVHQWPSVLIGRKEGRKEISGRVGTSAR